VNHKTKVKSVYFSKDKNKNKKLLLIFYELRRVVIPRGSLRNVCLSKPPYLISNGKDSLGFLHVSVARNPQG